ncbi:TadE/TadG family type IV pilus assembly protein [Streptomyces triticirhizae]|nr:TadE/TadG family type IV pilus assembly protein [Streptomyces triticirhizae]
MSARSAAGRRRPRGDRGAAMVEFAGIFPLVLLMMAVIWQCVLIGYTFSLAGNAADEAARAAAAARGDPGGACASAAEEHVPSAWEITVDCPLEGEVRTARVGLKVPVLFPGAFDLPMTVTGTAGAVEEG